MAQAAGSPQPLPANTPPWRGPCMVGSTVRTKERQAEFIAHLLDDALRLPGTRIRVGFDPVIGLVPVVGDALVTAAGASILLIGKQLDVPTPILFRMSYNLLLNGLVGAIPAFGDLFSLWFRSNAKNAALLIRAVSRKDVEACPVMARPLTALDVGLVLALTLPIILSTGYLSLWLTQNGITIF